MNRRQYKRDVQEITDMIAGVLTVACICFLVFVVVWIVEDDEPEVSTSGDVTFDMWRFESSPSDRRAILEGLTAMECIDSGLCRLTIELPVAGLGSVP